MYSSHGRLRVCLSLAAFTHYCTDPDVTWGNGRGCHLVVHHCWADLHSVHGFRCYDNIAPNAKCHRVLVLNLFLVEYVIEIVIDFSDRATPITAISVYPVPYYRQSPSGTTYADFNHDFKHIMEHPSVHTTTRVHGPCPRAVFTGSVDRRP